MIAFFTEVDIVAVRRNFVCTSTHVLLNDGDTRINRSLNVRTGLCACLEILHPICLSEGFCLFSGNLAFVGKVGFVANEKSDNVGAGDVADVGQPARDVVERVAIREIEDEESASRTAVVTASDRAEEFLAGCVPELKLDSVLFGLDNLGEEFDTKRRLALLVENIADKPNEKACLTNTRVANNNDLERVVEFAAKHCSRFLCGIVQWIEFEGDDMGVLP